jgi:hypothetical protein
MWLLNPLAEGILVTAILAYMLKIRSSAVLFAFLVGS